MKNITTDLSGLLRNLYREHQDTCVEMDIERQLEYLSRLLEKRDQSILLGSIEVRWPNVTAFLVANRQEIALLNGKMIREQCYHGYEHLLLLEVTCEISDRPA